MSVAQPIASIKQSLSPTLAPCSSGPVLFLCPAQWGIRNVVHSGMLAHLRAHGIRGHLLVGTPDSIGLWYPDLQLSGQVNTKGTNTQFTEAVEYGTGYTELLSPPIIRSQRGMAVLNALQSASFFRRYGIATDRVYNWWFRRKNTRWERARYAAAGVLSIIGSKNPLFKWQLAYMQQFKRRTWDLDPAKQQLEALRPSLLVATSCVMWVEEPYLLAARDLGIPTLGCIQSFDNLTSRSFIPTCDYYAVWNQRMHDQLLRFYPDRDPWHVHITGTPQFDFHVRKEFRWSRDATLERLGLLAGDRYILYAANFYHHTPAEPELVEKFVRRCATTPELKAHRIVVRLHPLDDYSRWNRLMTHAAVVVSRPSETSRNYSSPTDQARLVSSLLHADVCLNMWSTMSLDAAIVDTPVVCIAFAANRGGPEDRFCREAYNADFYRPIVESGGVRMACDMDQLVTEVVAYVRDRSRDQTKRRRLADEECGPLDGRSAERVAELITDIVDNL